VAGELAGGRVLLLAASAVTRELVKVYLTQGGAEVVEATDARGLAVALANGSPHVALVDLCPRSPPAAEVVALLAARGIPGLGLAGTADGGRAQAFQEAGGAGVMEKPLAPERLLDTVARLLPARQPR
jgi:DNA-binding NtrC family response regulator